MGLSISFLWTSRLGVAMHYPSMDTEKKPAASNIAALGASAVARWLREAIAELPGKTTNEKVKAIAAQSGVARATIYRILQAADGRQTSWGSIFRIATALGIDPPGDAPTDYGRAEPGARRAFAEDHAPYEGEARDWPPLDTANQFLRVAKNRVVDLEGVMPGDLLRIDMARPARAGDIVIAQFETALGAESKLRLYDPPYLVTASSDPALRDKPRAVDDVAFRIAGVVDIVVRRVSQRD